MKQNYTVIGVVLDESGSMAQNAESTRSAMNEFIKSQSKLDGECDLTIVKFSDEINMLYALGDIKKAPSLDSGNYRPDGMTALYDAIGLTIDSIGKALESKEESQRPDKIIICIQTDGFENRSCIFTCEDIKNKIEHQSKIYNWEFLFLGANQDAIISAGSIGISPRSALTYSIHNISGAISSTSNYVTAYRCSTSSASANPISFSQEDRTSAV